MLLCPERGRAGRRNRKMKTKRGLLFVIILCLSLLVACATPTEAQTETTAEAVIAYEQISAAEAKQIMDSDQPYVLLDVRTQEEFDGGHIQGAILLPNSEVLARAETVLPDKDAWILVYCRSGRRSKLAASDLVSLGYSNVKEFGGIIDWSYGTVTD